MSDIEQRLRDALDARAELVRPEDLRLQPALEPSEPDTHPWWRRSSSTYLFIAAVAVIVIALPLLALAATAPDGDDPLPPAASPDETSTMTDPVPAEVDMDTADLDGDGTADEIRVLATEAPEAVLPDHEVLVELSASGDTARYEAGQAREVRLAATANLDGRPGEDVVVTLDADTVDLHRALPVVLSLRDGELASILADDLGGGEPGDDGTRTHWWVQNGQLWFWRSQEPVAEGEEAPYAVDVVRFPREPVLRGVDLGTSCVTSLAATRLLDC